jgi:DNA-binding NtrC family response regulator
MDQVDGMDVLEASRAGDPLRPVIVMTAYGSVDSALEAVRRGAFHYLMKPFKLEEAALWLERAMADRGLKREAAELRRTVGERLSFRNLVGKSQAMQQVYDLLERVSPTSSPVLISGESGTGKELVAQTIHRLSPRGDSPYVPINCAAIPETLLESELFGHEKGAFTGAMERRPGCFELANHGTIFLDEIAEMTPPTQVKLLRVLQERSFRRLGGRNEQAVDIRVIAATNADPPEAVQRGRLRDDLFYRLNVFAIRLPPLRDRKEDLPLLIQSFIGEFNGRNNRSVAAVDERAMRILERYSWPGNVRELRNVMERATIVAEGRFIEAKDLPTLVESGHSGAPGAGLHAGTTVEEAERQLILLTLQHTNDNKTRAAELLGISLKTLHNKLNRLKIKKQEGVL